MRILCLFLLLLPVRTLSDEITLSGPPIWESAPLIALAETQPVDGVSFTFRPWTTPEELRKWLMADEPLMAIAPAPVAAIFAANGLNLKIVSATITEGSLSIVGRGAPIERLEDLSGTTLALPFKGYLPDLLMHRIAAPGPESWTPFYTGSLVAGMQLVLAGRADTALLAEPMATLALAQDPSLTRRADLCALWRGATALVDCPPAGVVIVNRAFDGRPEVIAAYGAAFAKLATEPSTAAALLDLHFPNMRQAAQGFSRIGPHSLPMPENAAVLSGFYGELLTVEPAAIGGALPNSTLYGP
ncbi:taurine ABC transporter substrate-binding protein [Paracoccus denitrificans]|jgi:NitT/TauT family transport system substrate-binding protein|uniref:Putative sulfonate/nitrate transport system substrate-binding protein n=1 Tax=Paracoccus denitrificans (strain Pd 1222) TaxID=318586 RepID=A1B244_PARDP|nr:taurine ABC transporter substrate-binding protein [Paracoccus denitrificans]ABL69588.1 putative sulfonate/nitrate transport system substrate-binding protein [Paracoccus denitrificans PD1222]MBB4626836.1 NitT/TauT family transport system substrate-binding protein [Paracoccus denitrificans]MCU7427681.1 ABC transporter substrate-binding protein [Paracoccus denitrificans]QAR24945.1 ABC transporter substrate-binding protein [Paracoccus denitrificans]UPV93880.1 ABC transporter substrate-binding p